MLAKEHFVKTLVLSLLTASLFITSCKVSEPGSLESSIARNVKSALTVGGKEWKNPVPYTEDAAKEGGGHFQHHCQYCHGLDGHATGVPFAAQMSPPVPDLSDKDIQGYTDGQLKWIVQNGIGPSGMPAWHGILEDDEMWKIVHYIRHLPAKGSLGSPKIFEKEAAEHSAMEQHGGKMSAGHHHQGDKKH